MDRKRRDPIAHEVKILPEYYDLIVTGCKTAELRKMDRDYQVGDILILQEWRNGLYTGRVIEVLITHITVGEYLAEGYGMLSFRMIFPKSEPMLPNSTFLKIFQLYCSARDEIESLKEELKQ